MRKFVLALTLVAFCAAVSFAQTAKAGSLAPANRVLVTSTTSQLLGSQLLPAVAVFSGFDQSGNWNQGGNKCNPEDDNAQFWSRDKKGKCKGTVPEPSVLWMLALSGIAGVAGLTVVRRMRRT